MYSVANVVEEKKISLVLFFFQGKGVMSSRKSVFGKGSSKNGKYGEMRNLMNAKRAGRAMRTTPAAAVQMATVQRAETALAMKNAGYVDVTDTAYSFVTGTTVKQIGVVKIGSAITQRIGGKIKWKSIQVRGVIQPESASAAPTLSSLIFVYDRYPQGDVPAVTAILATASSMSLLQDSNRSRFVIVRRLDYVTGPATGMAAAAGMGALNTQYNPINASSQQFGQQQADQYMNPYMQNVVNVQQSAAQRQADIARTGRNTQAVGSGAFGGSRQAIMDAEANRALADQQGAIQAHGLNTAYTQAQQQFNADQAARMQAQQANIGQQQFGANLGMQGLQTGLQAAGQLGQLGQNIYGQRMGINQLRNQYGTQQQQEQQAIINQQIQDYATGQQYPMLQLANMNALTRGLPMQSATTNMYQAAPSMASQLAGLGTAAYGLSQLGGSGVPKAKGGRIKEKKRPAGLAELALMKMQ